MAVVIPEVAEAAAGSEGLTAGAQSAVSSAAAGHGKHLTPEVAAELRKAATRKTTPKSAPAAPSAGGGDGGSAAGPVARAARAVNDQGAKVISGGHGGTAARVIFAFGAGLLALELASYLSGRYFTYHVGQGADKAKQASQVMGLYPGQLDKLKTAQSATPMTAASVGLNHYGGTATL